MKTFFHPTRNLVVMTQYLRVLNQTVIIRFDQNGLFKFSLQPGQSTKLDFILFVTALLKSYSGTVSSIAIPAKYHNAEGLKQLLALNDVSSVSYLCNGPKKETLSQAMVMVRSYLKTAKNSTSVGLVLKELEAAFKSASKVADSITNESITNDTPRV